MNNLPIELFQVTDSSFPSGAYAHSMGLESYVELGVVHNGETLQHFILQEIIPSLLHLDFPWFQEAYSAAGARDLQRLQEIDSSFVASKSTRELRQAVVGMGRQRLEILQVLYPTDLQNDFLQTIANDPARGSTLVVHAIYAVSRAIPADPAFFSYAYGSISGCTSAAMKLIRIGQNAVQKILTRSLADFREQFYLAKNSPAKSPAWFNPLLEIASARHERAYSRLFIS